MQLDDQQLKTKSSALLGEDIDSIQYMSAGGNSRLFKLHARGREYALKLYPIDQEIENTRLIMEKAALSYFDEIGIDEVPRFIAADSDDSFLIMSWCAGELIGRHGCMEDIDACLALIRNIKLNLPTDRHHKFAMAKESCLSHHDIIRQIEIRLNRLQELAINEKDLQGFLIERFNPLFEKIKRDIPDACLRLGMDINRELPQNNLMLIPADFGFHNLLKDSHGNYSFIDFEYFGWDDPVKLTADFLLHPAMSLTQEMRLAFLSGMRDIFIDDEHFNDRYQLHEPLFVLRWALILLNNFLPEKWESRFVAIDELEQDKGNAWRLAKAEQLAKAKKFIEDRIVGI